MANSANDVLSIARGEIGYNRWNDPEAGTKYGRWYAKDHGSYYGASGVPFCAMGVSWVFAQAGASCAGIPNAYVPYIRSAAIGAGKTVSKASAQPGDVVIFQWDSGAVDHVGIVEKNCGSYIQTIEFNTTINGITGSVGRRTRAWGVVDSIVRPNYGSINGGNVETLDVDGYWGAKTTLKLQQVLGAPYKDAAISRQNPDHKWRMPACTSGWEWSMGDGSGSQTIKLMQAKIGVAQDGIMGPDTINALIGYYTGKGSGAILKDGKLDEQSMTVKAMQRALNSGTF